jgi:hypothetical protein
MVASLEPLYDCPDCGSPGTVRVGVCDVCFADLGERRPPGRLGSALEIRGDTDDLRFADVLAELWSVVELAEARDDGSSVAAAARRARWLLESLRTQFHRDLGLPRLGASGAE